MLFKSLQYNIDTPARQYNIDTPLGVGWNQCKSNGSKGELKGVGTYTNDYKTE